MQTSTYTVRNARVLFPSPKVAEKNPDRWGTVTGDFEDAKGQPLTIKSKNITLDMVNSEAFSLDIDDENAIVTFTIESGQRGRKPSKGATSAEVKKALAAARK